LTVLAGPQPAGTYTIDTDEEEVPGLSFTAFQRTATMLRLPATPNTSGRSEVVPVDPIELAAALEADIALLIASKGAK